MQKIVETVFTEEMVNYKASKDLCVYNTTGPWILIDLYDSLSEQEKNEGLFNSRQVCYSIRSSFKPKGLDMER